MKELSTKKIYSDSGPRKDLDLQNMTDEQIDFSDIPELTDAQFKTARRGLPTKDRAEFLIDSIVLDWLKENSAGDLDATVNSILRRHVVMEIKKLS